MYKNNIPHDFYNCNTTTDINKLYYITQFKYVLSIFPSVSVSSSSLTENISITLIYLLMMSYLGTKNFIQNGNNKIFNYNSDKRYIEIIRDNINPLNNDEIRNVIDIILYYFDNKLYISQIVDLVGKIIYYKIHGKQLIDIFISDKQIVSKISSLQCPNLSSNIISGEDLGKVIKNNILLLVIDMFIRPYKKFDILDTKTDTDNNTDILDTKTDTDNNTDILDTKTDIVIDNKNDNNTDIVNDNLFQSSKFSSNNSFIKNIKNIALEEIKKYVNKL